MSGLDFISSLLGAIPAIRGKMKGKDTSQSSALSGQLANVANASYDQSNPLYQQLYGQRKEQNANNLAGILGQFESSNRRANAMGRVPLFAHGREGEQVFRQAVMAQQGADQTASDQTFNILHGATSGLNNALSAANGVSNANFDNTQSRAGGYTDIAELLRKLQGGV